MHDCIHMGQIVKLKEKLVNMFAICIGCTKCGFVIHCIVKYQVYSKIRTN